MRRLLVVCSALVLALVTVVLAPSLSTAQGQAQGQQAQPAQPGQPGQQQRGGGRGQGGGGGGGRARCPQRRAPGWADGHPRLGAGPDKKGIWGACCGSLSNAKPLFQPWAKVLLDYRRNNEFE